MFCRGCESEWIATIDDSDDPDAVECPYCHRALGESGEYVPDWYAGEDMPDEFEDDEEGDE